MKIQKRYFNVKKGSPKVNGGVIEVDISQHLEERLRDFIDNDGTKPWDFRLIKSFTKGVFYKAIIPKQKFTAGAHIPTLCIDNISAGYVVTGENRANVFLTNEGELIIRKTEKGEKVYVNEIDLDAAEKMREEAENWCGLQLYVCS